MDPGVHSLQYMDAIAGKDLGYRVNFYQNLRDVLNLIPKVSFLLLYSCLTLMHHLHSNLVSNVEREREKKNQCNIQCPFFPH